MKHLLLPLLIALCSPVLSQTNTCDLRLNSVELNPNSDYPQPILNITNVGTEPVVNFQIRWIVDGVIRQWSFSNSVFGGLLEPQENFNLQMPEIYVPQGDINCSFEVINLNNGNPNLGSCLIDQNPSDNKVFIDITPDGPSCIDSVSPFGICDEDQSLSVVDVNGVMLKVVSIEYFDLFGRKLSFDTLQKNTIYVERINYENGHFDVNKIVRE